MPDRVVTNAGSSSLATAVGGTIASNDRVYLNRGNVAITGDLDQSAKDLLGFFWLGDSKCPQLGSAASPVKFTCNQTGTGSVVLSPAAAAARAAFAAASGSEVWHSLLVKPGGNLEVEFASMTITTATVEAGGGSVVTFADTCTVTTLHVFGGSVLLTASGSISTATLTVRGGEVVCRRDLGTVLIEGGTLTVEQPESAVAAPSPTTVEVAAGATFRHSAGNVGTLTLRAGSTWDLSGLTAPVTVTTLNIDAGVSVSVPRGGVANLLTVTNYNPVGVGAWKP